MKKCEKCRKPIKETPLRTLKSLFRGRESSRERPLCPSCSTKEKKDAYVCQICQRSVEESKALTHIKAEEYILSLIKKDHPQWSQEKKTCLECIAYYRQLINKAEL